MISFSCYRYAIIAILTFLKKDIRPNMRSMAWKPGGNHRLCPEGWSTTRWTWRSIWDKWVFVEKHGNCWAKSAKMIVWFKSDRKRWGANSFIVDINILSRRRRFPASGKIYLQFTSGGEWWESLSFKDKHGEINSFINSLINVIFYRWKWIMFFLQILFLSKKKARKIRVYCLYINLIL